MKYLIIGIIESFLSKLSSLSKPGLIAITLVTSYVGSVSATQNDIRIVNSRSEAIYVSFTLRDRTAGPITWNISGSDCLENNKSTGASYAKISPGKTCYASVTADAGSSRFCASSGSAPTNCMNGQQDHLTLVETTFDASNCFGDPSCVWYDISVIPQNCTDDKWTANQCEGTGGASYNLPVELSCHGASGQPTYTCQGPVSDKYGTEMYPKNCGNPDGTCATGTPGCTDGVSAYFYPMFSGKAAKIQPNAVCVGGELKIDFLSGK